MGKLVFLPVSVGGGLLAGLVAKKLFAVIWGLIETRRRPNPSTATFIPESC
jgi:hypothetical protein